MYEKMIARDARYPAFAKKPANAPSGPHNPDVPEPPEHLFSLNEHSQFPKGVPSGTPKAVFSPQKEPSMCALNQLHSLKSSVFSYPNLKSRLNRTALALGLLLSLGLAPASLSAQDLGDPIIEAGDIAITGFSGLKYPEAGLPPGIDPLDESFINPDMPSLRLFRATSMGSAPQGQLVNLPEILKVNASEIGQVFGLAFDDGIREGEDYEESTTRTPDLYITATAMHGLQIVGPDSDGDGRPERLKTGAPDAEFMEGQFGLKNGGTPGAIWKVDGLTGEVSLFANVTLDGEENSGPGLGNIAFDKRTRQLFVSDLDTGMIHRFSLDGTDQDQFDHGTTGRAAKGLGAVAHDASLRMDIKDAGFKADDPSTWGMAQKERQVYGLQAHGKRLYYYAADGDMIMSVGINEDGSFGEARWELNLNQENAKPVTDIAFDNRGVMYLSMRGEIQNPYDYSVFAKPAESEVRRYQLEVPDDPATESRWNEVPDTYAVGMEADHKLALGGLDLHYGYKADGTINYGACDETLLKTGDNLRFNPDLIEQLSPGGPLNVHGVQFTNKTLVQPANTPPWGSYFADFDGIFDDPEARGQVGDVESFRPCEGRLGGDPTPYPWDLPEPEDYPGDDIPPTGRRCVEIKAIDYYCGWAGDLQMDLYLKENAGLNADSMKAKSFTPGVHVTPKMQTVAPATPFNLEVQGILPGEHYDVGVCLYNKADSEAGGEFPCCKAVLPLKAPNLICGP